jgi:hypothetical protein
MDRDIIKEFERRHYMATVTYLRKVKALYGDAIRDVVIGVNQVTYNGKVFQLDDFPMLRKRIDASIKRLQPRLETLVLNGIKESWDLSNAKNDLFVDVRLAGKKVSDRAKRVLYNPSQKAYEEFVSRKVDGLKLSDRIWKLVEPFQYELEKGLGVGIIQGKSATELAKDLQTYLENPDRLFRRVKDAEGKLRLSKAAKAYNPGQGVYRSSLKNATRLTRTETNISYRSADHERWKSLPFVTGVEVKLSNRHPTADLCDQLVGEYPKDFKFVGFHPQCICYAVPLMMSDEEYSKLEDQILDGEPITETGNQVQDIPATAKAWLERKSEMIKGLSSTPYFIKDNIDYVKPYLK